MEYRKPLITEAAKIKPLITCVITDNTPEKCIASIRNAIFDGADAFYLDITKLENEFRNKASISRIVDYCEDRPMIVMCYRRENRPDMTDERIAEELLMAVEAGASMVDMFGDLFGHNEDQLSTDEQSVRKQKEFIERIHKAGGEVLASSHIWSNRSCEEIVQHAKALESRGADMVKIACVVTDDEETLEGIKTTCRLKKELKVPFLHICLGQYGKAHRALAPVFGANMVLCVQVYDEIALKDQPTVRAEKALLDNLDYKMARDTSYGTVHGQRKDYY